MTYLEVIVDLIFQNEQNKTDTYNYSSCKRASWLLSCVSYQTENLFVVLDGVEWLTVALSMLLTLNNGIRDAFLNYL